jgi:hypothetical protein
MQTTSFAVNLSSRPLDETTLTWESHAVRIVSARALCEVELTGTDPAWIHVAGGGLVASFLFHPPTAAGSRRVSHVLDRQRMVLEARQELKVWGIRASGGGVFRVEIDWVRARRRAPVEGAYAAGDGSTAPLGQKASRW